MGRIANEQAIRWDVPTDWYDMAARRTNFLTAKHVIYSMTLTEMLASAYLAGIRDVVESGAALRAPLTKENPHDLPRPPQKAHGPVK